MNTPLDPLNPGKISTNPPNAPGTFLGDLNPHPTEPISTEARSTDIPATHVPHPESQTSAVPQHPSSTPHAVTSPHSNHKIQGDTVTPKTSPSDNQTASSMLETIIASAQNTQGGIPHNTETSTQTPSPIPPSPVPPAGGPLPPNTPPPKPPKQRTSPTTILKLIGSLIIVSIIFFGSFLSYIVFNPDSAGFFITIFGIDPNDIANLLKSLINVSFGTIVGLLAIVWIIALFRAIWTPKAQKRRKFLSILTAILLGFILFAILTFWIYLFQQIARTNYTNPNGAVLIYDNDLFIHEASK